MKRRGVWNLRAPLSTEQDCFKMAMEQLIPWFSLKSVPGIGNLLFKRLIDRFQSPETVFAAATEQLLEVEGMNRPLAERVRRHPILDTHMDELERADAKGYQIITYADSNYPPLLREIPDPPPYLYVSGVLEPWTNTIAVVGSRNATVYGLETARRLSYDLSTCGLIIVSGMALGVDTAAHEGALSAKGGTIAVLGSGLERIYPHRNRRLFQHISEKGAVVSEFPLEAEPEPHHFPIRNRIISGISRGTLVVEATRNSGSLITARLAAEQNREVFAVPGSIGSFKSTGAHKLLKEGAKLVEHAQDVLEELPPSVTKSGTSGGFHGAVDQPSLPALSQREQKVMQLLCPYPIHIDELVRQTSLDAGTLSGVLLTLELKGFTRQMPGKLFVGVDLNGH